MPEILVCRKNCSRKQQIKSHFEHIRKSILLIVSNAHFCDCAKHSQNFIVSKNRTPHKLSEVFDVMLIARITVAMT